MTEQEYEQKKRECFVKFCKDNGIDQEVNISIFDAFDQIFDRAYALGREKETITQEEIEKVAKEYVLTRQQARHNAKREEDATLRDFDKTIKAWDAYDMEQAFEDGYTASEQSMWRSVEDELPSNDHDVVASDENGLHIASYFNGEWYSCDDEFTCNPQMWMPIPSLPDTNTEKI